MCPLSSRLPKDPKSLHSYSVDNVITHPPHSYGHRTRRFTNLYPSGQNNETLLADTCRKNNFPHKQTIFYYPDFNLEYYSGVPFKTIAPTPSTHTTVRGNVTTLSDLLFSLHYSPENTYVVPPERILHVCYRIDLAGGHVDSSAGRTELTQDQIARICEIIDSI